MRILLYILQKEFIQVFRNRMMLPIIFLMPIFQLIILVYAATFEVKRVDVAVVDYDRSSLSVELINRIEHNPIFRIDYYLDTQKEAENMMQRNKADIALIIPNNFDKKLNIGANPDIQMLADAIVGNAAQLGSAYLSAIIMDFNKDVLVRKSAGLVAPTNQISISPSYWYNEQLNYKIYMAPGILVVLITIVGMLLGSINLVREKELGTIEQINVTPVKKWQFIAGKLLPFLIIGIFELCFGLGLAHLLFDMPIRGNFFSLLLGASIYLTLLLSIGLFFSTISETQQQIAFIGFFCLIVFIMLSGLLTPVESMPAWAQYLNRINPLYYFVRILRGIILKGATLSDLRQELIVLSIFAIGMFTLAIRLYKKRS